MPDRHEALNDFPVAITAPLHWGDQDAFGHVNNLIYLRWCETARVAYLTRAGLWPETPPHGLGPILASIRCDFKKPLTFPDTVQVGARITAIGRSSLQMSHRVVSLSLDAIAAEVESTLVVFDYAASRPTPIPEQVRNAIEEMEGRVFEAARK